MQIKYTLFLAHLSSDAAFQPAVLYLSSDSIRIKELSSVASVIVEIERAEDFANAQHVGPGYSLEGPRVLVVGLPLSLLLLHGRQTLSAHHLFEKTCRKNSFRRDVFTDLV